MMMIMEVVVVMVMVVVDCCFWPFHDDASNINLLSCCLFLHPDILQPDTNSHTIYFLNEFYTKFPNSGACAACCVFLSKCSFFFRQKVIVYKQNSNCFKNKRPKTQNFFVMIVVLKSENRIYCCPSVPLSFVHFKFVHWKNSKIPTKWRAKLNLSMFFSTLFLSFFRHFIFGWHLWCGQNGNTLKLKISTENQNKTTTTIDGNGKTETISNEWRTTAQFRGDYSSGKFQFTL